MIITVPSSAEEMLQNASPEAKIWQPTTGPPSGRLVNRPREIGVTFKPIVKTTGRQTGRRTMERKRLSENG